MKNKAIVVLLILLILFYGCSGSRNDEVISPITNVNDGHASIGKNESEHDPPKPDIEKTPALTNYYIPEIISNPEIMGNLWVYLELEDNTHKYLKVSFENNEISEFELPENCDSYMLPNTTDVFCYGGEKLELYNIESKIRKELPIVVPEFFTVNKNGKYIFYSQNHSDNMATVSVYDLVDETHVFKDIEIDLNSLRLFWANHKLGSLWLSPDGNKLVGLNERNGALEALWIFDFRTQTYNEKIVADLPVEFVWGLVWGQSDNELFVGTGSGSGIGQLWVDRIQKIDLETGSSLELNINNRYEYFIAFGNNGISSPNCLNCTVEDKLLGNQKLLLRIATTASNGNRNGAMFCFYELDFNYEKCVSSNSSSDNIGLVHNAEWSPDSKYIALEIYNRGGLYENNLVIYDIENEIFSSVFPHPDWEYNRILSFQWRD